MDPFMFKHVLATLLFASALAAQAAPDPALIRQLADDDSSVKIEAIQKLSQEGDPATARVLQAMADDGRNNFV